MPTENIPINAIYILNECENLTKGTTYKERQNFLNINHIMYLPKLSQNNKNQNLKNWFSMCEITKICVNLIAQMYIIKVNTNFSFIFKCIYTYQKGRLITFIGALNWSILDFFLSICNTEKKKLVLHIKFLNNLKLLFTIDVWMILYSIRKLVFCR